MRALVELEGLLLENKYGQISYNLVQRWKVEILDLINKLA